MKSRAPLLTTWPLAACLGAILAIIALPVTKERHSGTASSVEPRLQPPADAARAGAARFEARVPVANPSADAAALWRKLMRERVLEEYAARIDAPFAHFPTLTEVRVQASAAKGDPFGPAPVEASAPRVRIVGRSNVSGVWEGATVPLKALDAPSRCLTPSVGRVRAELADGTAFEGRLHSLGEGKIWLENDLGRMALLGTEIRTLRQLPPLVEASSAQELPELPLVRVRTPGGLFQGRLLRREEGRVTLLTAEGGQVTLDDAEVEPVRPRPLVRNP